VPDKIILESPTDEMFRYENGFYRTASVARISKFVTHLDIFRNISNLPGEIAECGVFKGSSLFRWIKFRSLLENPASRRVIAFDTFGKFPEASMEGDKERRARFVDEAGEFSLSADDIIAELDRNNLNENIDLVAGDILQTVPEYAAAHPQLRLALLHVDVDLYEPTKCCLEYLTPLVVKGGVIVLDDFGAFPGANKAIGEILEAQGMAIRKMPYSNAISYVVKD
jgi:hypothetical protein